MVFLLIAVALAASIYPAQISQTQTAESQPSAAQLISDFNNTTVFWKQFEIAKKIVALHDTVVLPQLEEHLSDEDRHLRGNAAFILASLGDDRGFDVINAILKDRSNRPLAQGVGFGNPTLHEQIREDRYYAAWLLGQLKDRRSVPILVQFIRDPEVNSVVPWALGEIGEKSAIPSLIETLSDESPDMRVLSIRALAKLDASEALPKLRTLLNDNASLHFAGYGSVADAAKLAISTLEDETRK